MEAHPPAAWGQALERVDLRRAADKELMTAQGLPRPRWHFLHREGWGGGCLCSANPETVLPREGLGQRGEDRCKA